MFDRDPAKQEFARYVRYPIIHIVWTELFAGEPIERRRRVEALLAPFAIVQVDHAVALAAADIRHGSRLNLMDALILATAVSTVPY